MLFFDAVASHFRQTNQTQRTLQGILTSILERHGKSAVPIAHGNATAPNHASLLVLGFALLSVSIAAPQERQTNTND
jgi:hypothetical protein